MTSPEVERTMSCALAEREVGREVLEPSSAVLQTVADHEYMVPASQLSAQVVVGVSIATRNKPKAQSG